MLGRQRRHLIAVGAVVSATAAAMSCVFLSGASAAVATQQHQHISGGGLPTIIVTMNGKKITVSGALRSGGVQVISKVTNEAQGEPTFVRLDPGVSVARFLAALPKIGADPNNVDGIGAIVFSPQANRGTTSAQVSLAAGQYVALDLGAASKVPPLIPFVISKSKSPATLPTPQAKIASIEFAFRGPGKLHDGELVRFANHGFLVHMIVAARGRNLAGAIAIARLLKAGKDGQAQRLATGFFSFVNVFTRNAYQQLVIHNRPGFWVLACFMDTQDHREHTQLGMERVIEIVP